MTDSIIAQIDFARQELLDLTLRNTLLNYRLLRARGVEAIDADPGTVYDLLVGQGRTVSFLPASDSGAKQPATSRARRSELRLSTLEDPDKLNSRLLNTYYRSRTLLEEQGVNTLFIALGMVRWYEDDSSDAEKFAPLILIPVVVERVTVRDTFHIRYDEGEVGSNLSFTTKAKQDFGLDIPGLHEDEEADDSEVDVTDYFERVQTSIEGRQRWSVDPSSVVLGFFAFQKLLMFRDLQDDSWQGGLSGGGSRVVASLFGDGFSDPGSPIGPDSRLDDILEPIDTFHVLDADSSQATVIVDVSHGRDLVVQGPPGTGKSQTIVNLIADAVARGRTVLFVSEKMAALEVVKRRLDSIHLGGVCLELHSSKTNKRAVLDELQRTIRLRKPQTEGITGELEGLVQTRDRLNRYDMAINTPVGETEVTPHTAIGGHRQLAASNTPDAPSQVDIVETENWTKAQYDRRRQVVSELQTRLRRTGVPREHLFWGTGLTMLLPQQQRDLESSIGRAIESVNKLAEHSDKLADVLGLSRPVTASGTRWLISVAQVVAEHQTLNSLNLSSPDWDTRRTDVSKLVESVSRIQNLRSQYGKHLKAGAWNSDLQDVRQTLARHGHRMFRVFSGEYRGATRHLAALWRDRLPKDVDLWIEVADAVIEVRRLMVTVSGMQELAKGCFGTSWTERLEDWYELIPRAQTYLSLIGEIEDGSIPGEARQGLKHHAMSANTFELPGLIASTQSTLQAHVAKATDLQTRLQFELSTGSKGTDGLHDLQFTDQLELFGSWSERLDEIHDIVNLNNGYKQAIEEELGPFVELSHTWEDASNALTSVLDTKWFESIVSRAYAERPEIREFDSGIHESHIRRFGTQDSRALLNNQTRVAFNHRDKLPRLGAGGEVATLRREFEKKRRHLPIRQLITRSGRAIQAIKPVFMMSPLSIANFLPPGKLEFDIVVFDEASQVRPVDALGALMRGKQAVVVGDSEQLPPTSFFASVLGEVEEDAGVESRTADMESVLSLFRAQGAPLRPLQWHYRSRHESLIALSNQEFYNNSLVVFASPDSSRDESGLRYHHLENSTYDRGRSRTNRDEALAVAEAVMEHARRTPELTLGVAAFSTAQSDAIVNALENLRRKDPSVERFFAAHPDEPFFIKNLENVQGDERDVIFISVGYGRTASGAVSMNFGPLNQDGGHRRLNVLITRARQRCHVFTNLRSEDIAVDETGNRGVRALREFLQYAETGVLRQEMAEVSGREPDSPIQAAVADALRNRGHRVHEEVASGGRFVDMAIVDPKRPGRYALGIEFDGASYHSALWARDRDRLREAVLKNLGWRLHRIWSTDWFRTPERELDRVEAEIKRALAESASPEASPTDPVHPTEDGGADYDELTEFLPKDEDLHIAPAVEEIPTEEAAVVPSEPELSEPSPSNEVVPYRLARPIIRARRLDNRSPSSLANQVDSIVQTEGPVHESEVIRRIMTAAGVKRLGSRVRKALEDAIALSARRGSIVRSGEFLWDRGTSTPVVRNRAQLPSQYRKIELISPEEVHEAVRKVREQSSGIRRDALTTEVASMLGFHRMSKSVRTALDTRIAGASRSQRVGESELVTQYILAEPNFRSTPLADRSPSQLVSLVNSVVRVEGPIHSSEVVRRLANATGLRRVTSRVREKVDRAIELSVNRGGVTRLGEFLWNAGQDRPPVRSRARLPQQLKIELIAPEEIREAVRTVVEHSYGIERGEAIAEVASAFGFRRTSANIGKSIDDRVSELLNEGILVESGSQLRTP